MTFYKSGADQRRPYYLVPGITGSPITGLEDFINYLSTRIASTDVIQTYTDERLMTDTTSLTPLTLNEMADIVFDSAYEVADPDEQTFEFILYSLSCLLAPRIQERVNAIQKTVKFTLIDFPTHQVLHLQTTQTKITNIANTLSRILLRFGVCPVPQLSEEAMNILLALAEEKGGIHTSEVLKKIFEFIVPDFREQIQIIGQDTLKGIQCLRTCHITLNNLAAMYNPDLASEPSKTVLQNAMIISTSTTMKHYECSDNTLGWGKYIGLSPNDTHLVVHLDEDGFNHFSILDPSKKECEILIRQILDFHEPNVMEPVMQHLSVSTDLSSSRTPKHASKRHAPKRLEEDHPSKRHTSKGVLLTEGEREYLAQTVVAAIAQALHTKDQEFLDSISGHVLAVVFTEVQKRDKLDPTKNKQPRFFQNPEIYARARINRSQSDKSGQPTSSSYNITK